jgi:hypothetical protein
MRHLKFLGLTLVALLISGTATVTSASALPIISVTLSEATYPLHLVLTALGRKTQLTNVVRERLTALNLLFLNLFTKQGNAGTYEDLFQEVKKGTTACFSEEGGKLDPAGEVLTKGTLRIVFTSLSGSPQGLQLGVLYLPSPITIKCGTEEITIKGDMLASIQTLAGTEAEEYTSLTNVQKGNEEGTPNIKVFYNEAGISTKAKLEANFGTGFKEAVEEVEEAYTLPLLQSKMFVVTSR